MAIAPALEVLVPAAAPSLSVAPAVGAEEAVVGLTPDFVIAKVCDSASWPVFCLLSMAKNLTVYCVPGLATKFSNLYSLSEVLTLATRVSEVSGAVEWSISSILNSCGSESTESHLMVFVLEKSSFAFCLGSVIWMAVLERRLLVRLSIGFATALRVDCELTRSNGRKGSESSKELHFER